MDKELQNQLASLIEAAKQAGSDAASFIQQHAPELCEQIIRWAIIDNALGVAIFSLAAFGFSRLLVWDVKTKSDDWFPVPSVVGAALGTFSLLCALVCVGKLIKVLVAPKLVLIEKIAALLN